MTNIVLLQTWLNSKYIFMSFIFTNLYISFYFRQVGEHYESILKKHCIESNMAFKDEKLLRKEGYDKTPDIKLEVPVLVNGVAIMWIESKALFANSDTHNIYVKEQLLSYWNRYDKYLCKVIHQV